MKLSHLSLAIFSAISLAACGGSNSDAVDNSTVPEKPETDKVEPVKPEQIVVDPTKTGVVGELDFKKESSVGTTQYLRGQKSNFDRVNNPSERTVATAIFGVNVDEQNPYLTNIALARLQDKSVPNKTLVQYLGNNQNTPADLENPNSLQQQNKHNVAIPAVVLASTFAQTFAQNNPFDSALAQKNYVDRQLESVNKWIEVYENDPQYSNDSLIAASKENLKKLRKVKEELETLQTSLEQNPAYGQDKIALLDAGSLASGINWGDGIATPANVVNLSRAADQISARDPLALGLVGIGYPAQAGFPAKFKGNFRIQGTEERSETSTRIFGRNFDPRGSLAVANSYQGADTFALSNAGSTAAGLSNSLTSFVSPINTINTATAADAVLTNRAAAYGLEEGVRWSLGATPSKLEYVQYGRVTGNLDPVNFTAEDKKSLEKHIFKRAPFLNKGDARAVDFYFYRGPDATTLEQMKAVAGENKVLTYRGHALMYGIDNEFHGKTVDAVPTAFGNSNSHGIGNFVEAEVDLSKNRLEKGIVYNVWQKDTDQAVVKDVLVNFNGNIHGNTVLGEAQRSYNKSDKADFRGSFYGDKAQELGGSFNSTTYQERYGAKGDEWGGVFGAQRTATPSSLSNAQLGDIPAFTTTPASTSTAAPAATQPAATAPVSGTPAGNTTP